MSSSSSSDDHKPETPEGPFGGIDEAEDDADVYTVERIVDCRVIGGIKKYEIKWKNYPSSENTWEPEENIIDKNVLYEYQDRKKEEKRNRQKKLEDWQNRKKWIEDRMKAKNEKSKNVNSRLNVICSDSSSDEDDSQRMPAPSRNAGSLSHKKDQRNATDADVRKSEGSGKYSFSKKNPDKPRKRRSDFGTTRKTMTANSSNASTNLASFKTKPQTTSLGSMVAKFNSKKEAQKLASLKPESRTFTDIGINFGISDEAIPAKKKKAKNKELRAPSKPKSPEPSESDEFKYKQEETLLGKGYEVDHILGLQTNKYGHLFYLVLYKSRPENDPENEEVEFILNEVLADVAPLKVIEYYQSILKFIPVTGAASGYRVIPDSGSDSTSSSSSSDSDSEASTDKKCASVSATSTESMTPAEREDAVKDLNATDNIPIIDLGLSDSN